jgi:hypothetical protein
MAADAVQGAVAIRVRWRMTEAEWLACSEPDRMVAILAQSRQAYERKLWLFAINCFRRLADAADTERFYSTLRSVEEYADGLITLETFREALRAVHGTDFHLSHVMRGDAASAANDGSSHCATDIAQHRYLDDCPPEADQVQRHQMFEVAFSAERAAQTELLRELIGPLAFRPVTFAADCLTWNDSTVRRIAQAIYDERAFDRLPILADALEDAGCDNADILTHCRGDGPHVRGCWVVDLLLGKE